MVDVARVVQSIQSDLTAQETDWLEWKSLADLGQRLWQARAARFILAAANRPRTPAGPFEGHAFILFGVEPGQAHGTKIVDPAVVEQGLARYLGSVGPVHTLDYVAIGEVLVAVVTVPPSAPGARPYLARGTLSADRPEIQDGRIYIRRTGISAEASAAEIDEMLAERVAARVAAGPLWPMQAEPTWRDGRTIHVRRGRGDEVAVHGPDLFTNLSEMAAMRPSLPGTLPGVIGERVTVFDALRVRADTEPYEGVEAAWLSLRAITVEVYEQRLGPLPMQGFKVVDMVTRMADKGLMERGWVDVSYPLYYWAIDQSPETVSTAPGLAKTYITLAKSLATALLLASDNMGAGRKRGN